MFCSGRQSMGCDLHTAAAKSVAVSDYSGFPGLTTEGLGHLPFFLFPGRWYTLQWENLLPVGVSQLGGAEGSFSKTE